MASWVTIYLKESLTTLDIKDIQQGIAPADWLSLGEDFDLEEEEVNSFMEHLQWKQNPLEIVSEDERPIQIHIWNNSKRIEEEITELDAPIQVQKHLANIKTIVAIEFGISQL